MKSKSPTSRTQHCWKLLWECDFYFLLAFIPLWLHCHNVVISVILSTLSCLQRLFFSIYVAISKNCKSRLFTSTISPNSYFTGLPLLIQPSELCIIHPQHVVAMKCRNAFSSIINNSCSENGGTKCKMGGRIETWREATQSTQFHTKFHLTEGSKKFPGCHDYYTYMSVWWGYWSVLMWNHYRGWEFWSSCVLLLLLRLNITELANALLENCNAFICNYSIIISAWQWGTTVMKCPLV